MILCSSCMFLSEVLKFPPHFKRWLSFCHWGVGIPYIFWIHFWGAISILWIRSLRGWLAFLFSVTVPMGKNLTFLFFLLLLLSAFENIFALPQVSKILFSSKCFIGLGFTFGPVSLVFTLCPPVRTHLCGVAQMSRLLFSLWIASFIQYLTSQRGLFPYWVVLSFSPVSRLYKHVCSWTIFKFNPYVNIVTS